jgi:tRNA 2-selenouridine synthase SelU
MPEQDNLADKFGELFNTVKNAGEKIAQAFQENVVGIDTLNSIKSGTLNFDLLEDDVKGIHRRLELDGYSVLGSRLVLDSKNKLMEIKTYSQKGEKNFVNTVSSEVKSLTNIPADVVAEMKAKGRIELSLKFDD